MASNFIYLASGSPRRRELLDQIGVQYHVVTTSVDESVRARESPGDYVSRLAQAKARAGLEHVLARRSRAAGAGAGAAASDSQQPSDLDAIVVLSADTAVVLDGCILGKPKDRADGLTMLASLSNRTHEVLTAVALATVHGVRTLLSNSEVTFRAIDAAEAAAYWDTGEPCDKAGGYGIQGLAAVFIAHLRGSYSGVMGLPLFETAQLLGARAVRVR